MNGACKSSWTKLKNRPYKSWAQKEKVNAKIIGNIFKKLIEENFPNMEKDIATHVQGPLRFPRDKTRVEPPHVIV